MDAVRQTGFGTAILSMEYDILIVGGGMVGSTLACMLAQQTSLSIAILEAKVPIHSWSPSHYHHRVSAIALSSQRIFKALQVWDTIKNKRVSPFTKIHVWDAAGQGKIDFDCKDITESVLGFIIENNLIQSALEEKLEKLKGTSQIDAPQIELVSPVNLTAFYEKENGIELQADDGRIFRTKLAIAADGAHSWLREQAGIALEKSDYGQEAIVATVETALPHKKIASQVFLETGPLAFLPLVNPNTSSIVWSLPAEEARRLLASDVALFKDELARAFSHHLGNIVAADQRYSFPLLKQTAKNYVKPRVALAGDAAHTVHPLAGQGVNMGLLDAASLAEVIVDAVKNRRDFSSLHNLRRYERWRKADNLFMLVGVDMIQKLFASDKKSIQSLRSLGVTMTNRVRWIKNIFTRHAVGDRQYFSF